MAFIAGLKKTCSIIIMLSVAGTAAAFNPYSTKELEELEKEFVQQINESDSVERSPLANEYINSIGANLAKSSGLSQPSFFIVKSKEINAFAGPGGYIGVNTELILSSENESELAAVMAHELAHVRLHHLYSLIEHEKQMRIPMLASILAAAALGVINPTLGGGALVATLSGFSQNNINFVRSNEKEADRIGISMLIKAGFNPLAMSSFFRKMQQHMRYYYTANIPAILRTHPMDEDRIAEAENRSQGHLKKLYPESLNYLLFKELIRVNTSQNKQELLNFYKQNCSLHSSIACNYGYAMALIYTDNYPEARNTLKELIVRDNSNLFLQLAMAEAEICSKLYDQGLERLKNIYNTHPANYATLVAYADGLIYAGKSESAMMLLLKGSRMFKRNLMICEKLAQSQAAAHKPTYAYFTQAQCQILQGRKREALQQLQRVKKMIKKDEYLLARTEALIEEIKFYAE